MRRHDNEMNPQPDKAPEARNTTWAGEHGEHLRSFQSPEEVFLLTLPFIERACAYGLNFTRLSRDRKLAFTVGPGQVRPDRCREIRFALAISKCDR